ncbi:MAG: hypothetical protein KDA66_00995 [Planctomycetaceae bacterium]|nr:hypothetical protein [Planctomycetaceae bacterium]
MGRQSDYKCRVRNAGTRLSLVPCLLVVLLLSGCNYVAGVQTQDDWAHYRAGGSFITTEPAYCPESHTVWFASPKTGQGDILKVDVASREVQTVIATPDTECSPHIRGLDCRFLFFERKGHNRCRVWRHDLVTGVETPFSPAEGYFEIASISPDGEAALVHETTKLTTVQYTELRLVTATSQDSKLNFGLDGEFIPGTEQLLTARFTDSQEWMYYIVDYDNNVLHELQIADRHNVQPDGTIALLAGGNVSVYSTDGKLLAEHKNVVTDEYRYVSLRQNEAMYITEYIDLPADGSRKQEFVRRPYDNSIPEVRIAIPEYTVNATYADRCAVLIVKNSNDPGTIYFLDFADNSVKLLVGNKDLGRL